MCCSILGTNTEEVEHEAYFCEATLGDEQGGRKSTPVDSPFCHLSLEAALTHTPNFHQMDPPLSRP